MQGVVIEPFVGAEAVRPHPRESGAEGGGISLRVEEQSGVLETIAGFARKASAKLFAGNFNFAAAQRPALMSNPISQLQSLIGELALTVRYVGAMGATADPVERLKLLTAGVLGNLCQNIYASGGRAPVAPRLGETFQGRLGGCRVYAEHLAAQPHTSQVEVFGPKGAFALSAYVRFAASISVLSASATVAQSSRYALRLADGSAYEWNFPDASAQKENHSAFVGKPQISLLRRVRRARRASRAHGARRV